MVKYVSRVIVMRNGSRIRDFKNYKKGAVTHATPVQLMDSVGVVDNPPQYPFSIDYVIPQVGAKQDWTDVEGETWTVQGKTGGPKTTYTGVKFLSEGDSDADGQKEMVMTLSFIAEDRIFE
jgi:hypothetical protein